MDREEGFTLIELLATMTLLAILLTLGVAAIRNFWMVRSFTGAQDQVATQLRALQQQAVAESNPLVFGAWFKTTDGSAPQWGLVRYDPGGGGTPASCDSTATRTFDSGVRIAGADFSDSIPGLDPGALATCQAQIGAAAGAVDWVFFLARGTATPGCVTITHPSLERDDIAVSVGALTGRVEKVAAEDVNATC